jgi:hypothetical protein
MASACTKYQTLIMKGLCESPSPKQEQIIALTAAVSSLKSKTRKVPGGRTDTTGKPRDQGAARSGARKNDDEYAWKDVAPKAGEPNKKRANGKDCARKNDDEYAWKDVAPKAGEPNKKRANGKDYFWCTRHKQPQWTLHNPDSFPNLCKYHPKYAELEAAWKAGSDSTGAATAEDIKLELALAAIQDSESESEDL